LSQAKLAIESCWTQIFEKRDLFFRRKESGTSCGDERLQALLGTELPLIQARMAGVQGSTLAVAVSNAGGLGSLPCAMLRPEELRSEFVTLSSQTKRPFNVNFFCHTPPQPNAVREASWRNLLTPYYKEFGIDIASIPAAPGRAPFSHDMADVLAEFKPSVVSFHFGLPSDESLKRVRSWGAVILSSATTIDEALWLQAHGADAIIAQGLEAGGHRGHFLSRDLTEQMSTFALVPQVVREVKVPVIAAGGIADARGVAAAMALGAVGVQVGTAYMLCPEATTGSVHRAALKSAGSRHTALTNLFSGGSARGIMNRAMRELGPMNESVPEFPLGVSAMAPLRAKAEAVGSGDFSPLWSGQNSAGCHEIPATELTQKLVADIL
jgi:nitronate monooxygenase